MDVVLDGFFELEMGKSGHHDSMGSGNCELSELTMASTDDTGVNSPSACQVDPVARRASCNKEVMNSARDDITGSSEMHRNGINQNTLETRENRRKNTSDCRKTRASVWRSY